MRTTLRTNTNRGKHSTNHYHNNHKPFKLRHKQYKTRNDKSKIKTKQQQEQLLNIALSNEEIKSMMSNLRAIQIKHNLNHHKINKTKKGLKIVESDHNPIITKFNLSLKEINCTNLYLIYVRIFC